MSDPLYDSPLGWQCSGNAKQRDETSSLDEIVLGGINCKPFSSTFATKMQCGKVADALALDSDALGYAACACADDSDNWADSGCCLAAGMIDHMDLTGSGCLYRVPGILGPNYAGKDPSASGSMDVGSAMKGFIDNEESKQSGRFMCPAGGYKLTEHMKFNNYEYYHGQKVFDTYYNTGRPRIQQNDKDQSLLDINASVPFEGSVSDGNEGTYYTYKSEFED